MKKINNNIFFEFLLNNQQNISVFITNDKVDDENIIYSTLIDLTEKQKQGLNIQLKILGMKIIDDKKFYLNYLNFLNNLNKTSKYQNDYYNYKETYILSTILLCENSIKYLSILKDNEDFFIKHKNKLDVLLNLSNNIIDNIEFIDIRNINVYSSIILFLYGIRVFNDIDVNVKYYNQKTTKTKSFIKKLNKIKEIIDVDYFISYELKDLEKAKPDLKYFVKRYENKDLGKRFYDHYNNSLVLQHYKANSESIISYNSDNYFYFLGLKFISLEYEMYKRFEILTYVLIKNNVTNKNNFQIKKLCELIFICNKYNILPKIPYNKIYGITDELLEMIQKEYLKLFNINISKLTISNFIEKTKTTKIYDITILYS